ncbi:hypothetical protein [Streptomyces sp. TLI_185]|uniref:hypothetical protein n=1 Tax=Streptomyces sp. TLI_185 TaxID=2485151 RepID=UPI000F4EFC5F|nr:hypothetical protein [Streptomyces sp. TLI_185]RPF33423.1 hypothetical protein EDD92_3335 [Streptomyces sp. TLI_185]
MTRTTTAKKCPRCGRVMGELSCRPVKLGFFCMRDYLILDDAKLIHPTPDPIGEAEQSVIDEYAPQIEKAESLVDAALEAFSAAQSAHFKALTECHRVGIKPQGAPELMRADGGAFGLAVDAFARRALSGRDRRKLTEAEENARGEVEAAEDQLSRERRHLSKIERAYDNERRAAKSRDRDRA